MIWFILRIIFWLIKFSFRWLFFPSLFLIIILFHPTTLAHVISRLVLLAVGGKKKKKQQQQKADAADDDSLATAAAVELEHFSIKAIHVFGGLKIEGVEVTMRDEKKGEINVMLLQCFQIQSAIKVSQ